MRGDRVDHDRGWSPTLDRLRGDARIGRGDLCASVLCVDDAGHAGRRLCADRGLFRDGPGEACCEVEPPGPGGGARGWCALRPARPDISTAARPVVMSSLAAYVTAGVLLLAITAYSTAGGVDFGAGIWDLLACRGKQGPQARAPVGYAMAPVWEVNNVWLLLAIVVCWTSLSMPVESVFASLYPPFS